MTFYSYKGGTGRTMALANVACLLGQELTGSEKVLVIDWDLEAPGLHYYLGAPEDRDVPPQRPGVVELFTRLSESWPSQDPAEEEDTAADRLIEAVSMADFIQPTRAANVDLMSAGRVDDTYQSRLTKLDWEGMYNRCPAIYRAFARSLASRYGFVLVDSRTGMTDISGICTALLPDKLVVVFTPNRQSLTGIEALVARSTQYRQDSKDLRSLMVYPLPSRIDNQFESLRNLWRHGDSAQGIEGYQPQFERILTKAYALTHCDLSAYCEEIQIQHSPEHSYGEPVAALDPTSKDRFSIVRSYRALVDWVRASAAPWERPEQASARKRLALVTAEIGSRATSDSQEDRRYLDRLEEAVALSRAIRGDKHPETLAVIERLIEATLANASERGYAIALLNELLGTMPMLRGPQRWGPLECVLQSVGTLRAVGDTAEADRLRRLALEVLDADAKTMAADGWSGLVAVAGRLRDARKLFEAYDVLKRVLEHQLSSLGQGHPATLTSMGDLASILRAQGDFARARALQELLLEHTERALGRDHPDTLKAMRNLGLTLQAQGEFARAQEFQERVLQATRLAAGENHPNTLMAMNDLASTVRARGNLGQARVLYQQVLELSRRAQGDEHPATLEAMGSLASTLLANGDLAAALSLQEELVARTRAALGQEHVDTVTAISNLGLTFQAQGRLNEAAVAFEEAIKTMRGPAPRDADSERALSLFLLRMGDIRMQQAELVAAHTAYEEALAIARALATRDPANSQWQRDLSVIACRIGAVRVQQGDLGAGLAAYEEATAIARALAGRDAANSQWRRDLSVILQQIGEVQAQQGNLDAAQRAYQEAMAIARTLAEHDPNNSQWVRDLSMLSLRIGDVRAQNRELDTAREAYEEAMRLARSLAERDPNNAQWMRDISIVSIRIGDVRAQQHALQPARAALDEARAITTELVERDPGNSQLQQDLLNILERIAELRFQEGDAVAARTLQEQVLETRTRLAGPEHPDTLIAMGTLASMLLSLGDVDRAGRLQRDLRERQRKGRRPYGSDFTSHDPKP